MLPEPATMSECDMCVWQAEMLPEPGSYEDYVFNNLDLFFTLVSCLFVTLPFTFILHSCDLFFTPVSWCASPRRCLAGLGCLAGPLGVAWLV